MTKRALKGIIKKHLSWLKGDGGERANLRGANLQDADLRGADLWDADLRDADLRGANLPYFQISDGDLIVWKKGKGKTLIRLLIPKEAKRTASLVGRKCRAEYAKVLEITKDGETPDSVTCWNDKYDLVYTVGEIVHPDKYDDDIRVECTNGIHFFLTKEEAEAWS